MAILNDGELVAQASTEALLSSPADVVYRFQTQGEIGRVLQVISRQPWVSAVKVDAVDGQSAWTVSVTDEESADDQPRGALK
ncbi:MAG: hypothetical protein ACM3MF_10830 [Anaerolineae bacterium]